MAQRDSALALHEDRLVDLWERMIRTIGVHSVNVLFDRALWEVPQKHPEIGLIKRGDEGLSFEALNQAYANRPDADVTAVFSDLTTELMLILARLLGKDVAQRLSEELQAKMPKEKNADKRVEPT